MKPIGMTADFRIIRPTSAEDAIWNAVSEAIIANMTPEQFKREAAEAWRHNLEQDIKSAVKEFAK